MAAACCRTRIQLKEVDRPRLEQALRGLFKYPSTEIAVAFRMVVRDIPPELEKKICATMTFSEAVYLLKQSLQEDKTDKVKVRSLVKWTEKMILIRNVACFCRKPTRV